MKKVSTPTPKPSPKPSKVWKKSDFIKSNNARKKQFESGYMRFEVGK